MSLQTNVTDLATRIATETKTLRTLINGNTVDLSALTTTAKGNLVAAVNEVRASVGGAGATINDTTPSGTNVFSSTKTNTRIAEDRAALKLEILGGVGAAYDTLVELQNIDISQDSSIAGLVTADGNRVRFDAVQTLTAPQKVQANTNMGSASTLEVGDVTANFVATFNAGLI